MVRERKDTKWTLIPEASKDNLKLTAIYRFLNRPVNFHTELNMFLVRSEHGLS